MNDLTLEDSAVVIGTRRYPITGNHVEVWNGSNWSMKMNHEQPRYTEYQQKLIYQAVRQWQLKFPVDGSTYRECAEVLDGLVPFVYTANHEQST